MGTLLIRNAIALFGAEGGAVFVRDGVIESLSDPGTADTVIDATGCVVTPGLINTHHHLFQSLTRAVPGGQDALLFGWLQSLYPIWRHITPENVMLAVQVGLAELALSGCTTASDHQYWYPNGITLDDSIAAAREVGVRFTATRGSLSIGESAGGLPPDDVVEDEDAVLIDSERLVAQHHDPSPGALTQVALAPCSPFTVSERLMRESAALARRLGVRLHTHTAENDEDIAYSLERFGKRPGDYMADLGWTGEDTWHAHCVKLDPAEIAMFAATGTGVATCPCSNARLGSGIAPVRAMRDAGVPVGLGVDGSASSDAAHLLQEARELMLHQRLAGGASAFSAREALTVATSGGARVLGRPELGRLAPGHRADLAVWDLTTLQAAGAWDPIAALVLTGPHRVRDLIVEGREVVRGGRLLTVDEAALARRMRATVARLAG